jgi:translation initiation factor 2A
MFCRRASFFYSQFSLSSYFFFCACSGDSRLFLFSTDGKVNTAVPQAKEGPVADFSWNPTDSSQFIVIAGKSPPAATLHTLPKGDAVFSFGAGAFNTVKYQPQGKMVILGGFGNMSGDLQVWDCKKYKAVSPVFNTPVATHVSWAPSGRHILAATTRPRLMVDNGYRVWSYKGQLLHHAAWEQLFEACWRSQPIASFPDRPPSPMLRGKAAAAAAAAAGAGAGSPAEGGAVASPASGASAPVSSAPAATSSGGKYVPPHLRNAAASAAAVGLPSPKSGDGGGSPSMVSAMMSEGYQKAGRIGPGGISSLQGPKPVAVIPGMDPAAGAAKKKKKRRGKGKGGAAAAGGAAAEDADGDDGEEGDD